MQASANHGDPSIVVLSPEHRVRLERELDFHLEQKAGECAGLHAIEDRERVRDAWALLDLLAGEDFERARVVRIVGEMAQISERELANMTRASLSRDHMLELIDAEALADDLDSELEARAAFSAVLGQIEEEER